MFDFAIIFCLSASNGVGHVATLATSQGIAAALDIPSAIHARLECEIRHEHWSLDIKMLHHGTAALLKGKIAVGERHIDRPDMIPKA